MIYTKQVESIGSYDVCVLGGGPSGVASATAAARDGAKVLLVESTASLGGMATAGLVGPFMTSFDREGNEITTAGIFREVVERLKKYGAAIEPAEVESPTVYTSFIERYHRHVTPFEPFYLQIVLDKMVREAGVELICYTQFVDTVCENGKIKYAVLNSAEGLVSVEAKVFVDCTGIAAVAEASGVPTYKGDEESGTPQPATLMFEVGGVSDDGFNARGERPERPVKAYRMPSGKYKVNHYHVFNVDAASSKSLTDAHSEARYQVLRAFDVLHDKTEGFENAKLLSVASVLGVRESRHIEGEYKITVADVKDGTKFDDRIAVYGYGMDIHNRTPGYTGNFKIEVAERYYIPYRSLIPKGCENLLVAGKTLACDSQAVGGMRCMPAAFSIGEAAGIASSMAAKGDGLVRSVDVKNLQKKLLAVGAIID